MNARDGLKFLVVTASSAWETTTQLAFTNHAITLEAPVLPKIEDEPLPFQPLDLTSDSCGTLHALLNQGGLVVYDRDTGYLEKIPDLELPEVKKLAVSENDLYLLVPAGAGKGGCISCLARVNHQLRWETLRPETEPMINDFAANADGALFILAGGEIALWSKQWGTESVEFKKCPVLTEPTPGSYLALSCLGHQLFVLCHEGGSYSVCTYEVVHETSARLIFSEARAFTLRESLALKMFTALPSGAFLVSDGAQTRCIKFQPEYFPHGSCVTAPLDSTIPGCPWHRVVIDCDLPLPDNTRIELAYAASEALGDDPVWQPALVNTRDALILEAKGRYLRLKLDLFSDVLGTASPVVKSLRVEFPHQSYLRYLPAVYQEDPAGSEFLRRFLSIFETLFQDSEEKIFSTPRFLDPESAPDHFLPWLAQWLALPFDENLPSDKLRRLIQAAPELRRRRGTREGLQQLITIYTDQDRFSLLFRERATRCKEAGGDETEYLQFAEQTALVVENFQMRKGRGEPPDSPEAELYGKDRYNFYLFFKPFSLSSSDAMTLKRIVETEKPAHTTGYIVVLEPWFCLGGHSYLGINTIFSEPIFTLGASVLSFDTTLGEREPAGQLKVKSRVGADTVLF